MVDQSDKRSDGGEVNNNNNNKYPEGACSEESQASEIKRCADCGTSKTPLWRGGPAGPKSLCNACGIRSRKKRRAILGLKPENEKKSKKSSSCNNSNSNNSSGSTSSSSPTATATTTTKSSKMGSPLHQRLIALGREVMMQKSTADKQYRRRKLGEEEQAAVLLMALSYGSVFA